jgi:hypothetical protein
MRAILIDPVRESVTEVDFSGDSEKLKRLLSAPSMV